MSSRRRLVVPLLGLMAVTMLTGCGNDLDPVVGNWRADASHAETFTYLFRDFGNQSTIDIRDDGKVTVHPNHGTACGGEISRDDDTAGAQSFRITLGCAGLPRSMVTTLKKNRDGPDVLEVSIPDEPDVGVFRFERDS
jgi:hypothetical protein